MRRAVGPSPEGGKLSSLQVHPREPRHPKAARSRQPSPPTLLKSWSCQAPAARARRVIFEDEVLPPGRPPGRVPPATERGSESIPPALAPGPRAVPDYVMRYPAIRSPRQREGYKGVFQDQLAEYTELLRELRAARPRLGEEETATGGRPRHPRHPPSSTVGPLDRAFLGKQQRCEYLQKKLTHIKARIQDYDRGARPWSLRSGRGTTTPGGSPGAE